MPRLFSELRGALTEQFILQQLKKIKALNIYYRTNERGSAEIDFVIDTGKNIIPLEVKAEQNLKAKSLKAYSQRFKPDLSIRTSMADYRDEGLLLNVPLYSAESMIPRLL